MTCPLENYAAATSSRRLLPHHGGCYLITEAADIIFSEIHLHRRLIMSQVRFQEANVILLVQDPFMVRSELDKVLLEVTDEVLALLSDFNEGGSINRLALEVLSNHFPLVQLHQHLLQLQKLFCSICIGV